MGSLMLKKEFGTLVAIALTRPLMNRVWNVFGVLSIFQLSGI